MLADFPLHQSPYRSTFSRRSGTMATTVATERSGAQENSGTVGRLKTTWRLITVRSITVTSILALAFLFVLPPAAGTAPLWQQDGNPVSPGGGDQEYPAVIPYGAGGAYLTWQDFRNGNWDVYAQRVNPAGSAMWSVYDVPICRAEGNQEFPTIAPDGNGGAIIVWQDSRNCPPGEYRVYAQRVDSLGMVKWTGGGIPLCAASSNQQYPQLIPDGVGGAIVAWQDFRLGGWGWDVYAQRVNASGTILWGTNAVAISQGNGGQELPKTIPDGIGGAVITWRDYRGGNYDIYAQRVNSAGTPMWTANGVALCLAAGDQSNPEITSDGARGGIITWSHDPGSGNVEIYAQRIDSLGVVKWTSGGAIISWYDQRGGTPDIYAQRVGPFGNVKWTVNGIAICSATGTQWCPELTADGTGGAIVTWRDSRGSNYDIYAQRVDSLGAVKWTANGVAISAATGDQDWPAISSDGAGGGIIAWWDKRNGADYDIYGQRVNASGTSLWTENGIAVSDVAVAQYGPKIASDYVGGAIITWEDARNGLDYDVYAQRMDSMGALKWTSYGVALSFAASDQQNPEIAADGVGGVIIAWRDQPSDSSDLYAQRLYASGVAKWVSGGVPVCTAIGRQENHKIISDGAQGALIAWNDYKAGTSDIYAQRVDSLGTASWTLNGVPICTATSFQVQPELTTDGAGGAVVTWIDYRNRTHYDIYAQRVNVAGAIQWTTNGVAVCAATGDQGNARITSDGVGGAIIVWQDHRGSSYDIYAQRINASGVVQWTANGVAICTATGDQEYSSVMSDGVGGAIIVWQDHRSGTSYDIYAQRINASGVVQWTANGVAICTATGDQALPKLAPDGTNPTSGAIITWQDYSSGSNYDIYAQRVDALGNVLWTTNGVIVCAATEDQQYPEIAPSLYNAGTIVWQDGRGGIAGSEIYAMRVRTDGGTIGVEKPVAKASVASLNQNVPNPFNPFTRIAFSLAHAGNVTLRIYDVAGRPVRMLVDGWRESGAYSEVWDGRDEIGRAVASGVYLYRLEMHELGSQRYAETRKMVLLR